MNSLICQLSKTWRWWVIFLFSIAMFAASASVSALLDWQIGTVFLLTGILLGLLFLFYGEPGEARLGDLLASAIARRLEPVNHLEGQLFLSASKALALRQLQASESMTTCQNCGSTHAGLAAQPENAAHHGPGCHVPVVLSLIGRMHTKL